MNYGKESLSKKKKNVSSKKNMKKKNCCTYQTQMNLQDALTDMHTKTG